MAPVWKQEEGQGTERQTVPAPSRITAGEARMATASQAGKCQESLGLNWNMETNQCEIKINLNK